MAPPKSVQPTLYEILSLTPKHLEGQTSTAQSKVVKKAYHKALLQNHPDKVNAQNNSGSNSNSDDGGTSSTTATKTQSRSKSTSKNGSSTTTLYTVDQIQEAYNTLSDSKKRAIYNRSLATQAASSSSTTTSSSRTQNFSFTKSFQTGLEIVDLDDVDFDDRKSLYFRACRCGNPRGYRFKERDLEDNEDEGVLMVECLDCSLWLRVLFTADVGSGDEQTQPQQPQQQKQKQQNGQRQNSTASFSSSSSQPQNVQRVSSNQGVQRNNAGEKKGGWGFKLSLGLSLGGSASASASSGSK